jgi:hypothetical protein
MAIPALAVRILHTGSSNVEQLRCDFALRGAGAFLQLR